MKTYVAVVEPSDDGRTWWISFPGLPGITSAADDATGIAQHAREALESARDAGVMLAGAVEEQGIPAIDLSDYENPVIVLVPLREPAAA